MNIFSTVGNKRPKKNKFDLSHEKKMSMKIGSLIPMMVQEILPGDNFKVNTEIMMRLAPMISPVMHRMQVYTHYFFVPNRLVWSEWEDFITGGPDGTSLPTAPYFQVTEAARLNFLRGSLADYMGLPSVDNAPPITAPANISALPFRAYQLIYNEYFRDQNLETPVIIGKQGGAIGPGAELADLLTLRTRGWEKDYFTSALPWTQRGPEVTIPFSADVNYKDISDIKKMDGTPAVDGDLTTFNSQLYGADSTSHLRVENIEDITNGTSTINDLRRSVRLQEWLEKNARGGARYIEQLLSHWGIAPNDERLQRPQFLAGGTQPVVISEVLSTYDNTANDLPQGEMSGHGISVGRNNGFSKTFSEHGYVIGVMSVRPKTAYYQGIPKHLQRVDKLEYAWPEFAQLGEQEIKQKELFWNGGAANEGTFGYTPRYSEYKYGISTVHGEFRTSLDYWHMARKFSALPPLNADFIKMDPDDAELKRIFAVTDADTDDLYVQLHNSVSAIRSLPYYGTPTL